VTAARLNAQPHPARPHSIRPHRARPPLNPAELVDFTRFLSVEVRSGRYPFVEYDPDMRWHQRIYRDDRVDAWLISWLPAQGTALHDHGGSAGAFTVITGELAEAVYLPTGPNAGTLRERQHGVGRAVGFDARHVHDVRNTSSAPAVSVHAYSRPLTSMTFYDVDEHGRLGRLLDLPTDDPEPDVDPWAVR
jgi:Cysteine dioxygenase type I